MKRKDYLHWDEYFMGIALLSSQRSKDPGTQVGACIVNSENRIRSVGYNGFPMGCSDDYFPWDRSGDNALDTKYMYVCHAELNAILNYSGESLYGCRLYTSLFPCNECAKAIIQAGISEVIYLSDKYAATDATLASKRMLRSAGVKLTRVEFDQKELVISYKAE